MLASRAMAAGVIEKTPCVVCGAPRVHAHHQNYHRPLALVFLCPPHHRQHHGGYRCLKNRALGPVIRSAYKRLLSESPLANFNHTKAKAALRKPKVTP